MSGRYEAKIHIGRQEDGLWRVEVPDLHGCWVDAPTLAQALAEIQEGIAMALDEYEEQGWEIPSSVRRLEGEPEAATLPVIIREHAFIRMEPKRLRVKPRSH